MSFRPAPKPNWGWQDFAACSEDDLVLFFGPDGERLPERDKRERAAKQVCTSCPVMQQCRETAFVLKHDTGVWGGLGEDERKSKRRTWLKNTAQRGVSAA